MTTLTIRNVEPVIKDKLRLVAASHGRSMEEEVRIILRNVLAQPSPSNGLGSIIHARFAALPTSRKSPRKTASKASSTASRPKSNLTSDLPTLPKRSQKPRAAKFDDEAKS
jgi:plasmid stability protein